MKEFEFTTEMGIRIGVIVLITVVLLRTVKWFMDPFIRKSSAVLKINKTRYRFFRNILNTMIIIMAVILIIDTIPALRSVSMTLFASAGILAAVIGFASQQAMSNIISGVFVVISRPFRVGDTISVGNPGQEYYGVVEDITLRHTVIRDLENARIIIPNSIINMQTLINHNIIDARCRRRMLFKVSPLSDTDQAIRIIQQSIFSHPKFQPEKDQQKPEDVHVDIIEVWERYVLIRAYAWTRNIDDGFELQYEVTREVMRLFREQGIDVSDTRLTENNAAHVRKS